MLKKISILSALLCLLAFPASLFAQDDDGSSVDVDLAFVSNYIFRGTSFHQNYYNQKGEAIQSGTLDGQWAFQPSITFNTGSGAYFNIWGSFAMENRQDVDTDGRLQTSPGGPDLLAGANGPSAQFAAVSAAVQAELAADQLGDTNTGIPGYYDEQNGLRRSDEVDFSVGYAADTSAGSMDMGIIVYVVPIAPELRSGAGDNVTEMYFAYNLPAIGGVDAITGLGFTIWQEIGGGLNGSNTYSSVGYDGAVPLSEDLSFDYGTSAGYQWSQGIQGWRDWTSYVGVSVAGFSFAFNYVVRPDYRFHDGDATVGSSATPAWLVGGSTNADGLVTNPAFSGDLQQAGIAGIQAQIDNAIGAGNYTYVERQKLPRAKWYFSVGYSVSL